MPTADTLLILAYLCDPAPHGGYGWQVDEQLAAHDSAMETLAAATSDREWWAANAARIAAEARIARLLDVKPQPQPPLEFDDGFGQFFAQTN